MKSRALLLATVCGLITSLAGCNQDVQRLPAPITITMAVRADGKAAVDPKPGDILQWSSPAPDYPSFKPPVPGRRRVAITDQER